MIITGGLGIAADRERTGNNYMVRKLMLYVSFSQAAQHCIDGDSLKNGKFQPFK